MLVFLAALAASVDRRPLLLLKTHSLVQNIVSLSIGPAVSP